MERIWTPEEIELKTKGYLTVPQKWWPFITPGSRIVFYDINDRFNGGGIVYTKYDEETSATGIVSDRRDKKLSLRIGYKGAPIYKCWDVKYEEIKEIKIKLNVVELMIIDALKR